MKLIISALIVLAPLGHAAAQSTTQSFPTKPIGAEPMQMSPEQFDAFLRDEFNTLGDVMRAAGVKAQ